MQKHEVTKARLLAMAEAEGLRIHHAQGRMQCPARCSDDPRGAKVDEPQGYALWECKHCGAAGDAISFLQHARSISPAEAMAALEGAEPPKPKPPAPPRRKIDPVRVWEGCAREDPEGLAYLERRGLAQAAALDLVRFSIGNTGERWVDARAAEGYRVAMPLYSADLALASLQFRATRPTDDPSRTKISLAGISTSGLAFGAVRDARTEPVVYVAEGIADTLALLVTGHIAIGAPGVDVVAHLDRFLPPLPASGGTTSQRTVVLCRQRDPNPKAQATADKRFAELAARLQLQGARVVTAEPPAPHKDPAEVLERQGPDALRAYLQAALATRPLDPVQQARAIVQELAKRLSTTPGAAVEERTLAALEILEQHDLPAYVDAMDRIGRVKGLRRTVEKAQKARRLKAATAQTQADTEPTTVADSLRDAPAAAADLRIPKGYYLTADATGVLSVGVSLDPSQPPPVTRQPITTAPVIIAMRHRDEDTGTELLRLAWRRRSRWYSHIAPKQQVANAAKLIDLAEHGLPVHSGIHQELCQYLAAFEAANDQQLTGPRISSRLGWQGRKPGDEGFLLGRSYIPADGSEPIELDLDDLPEEWRDDWIVFRGADAGDEQTARAFSRAGSFESWLDAITPLQSYPRALIALYASFVPPLLPILGAPNFILDFAGRTSLGKTTVLMVAASVWGCPDGSAESTLGRWDATRVAVERKAALLSGLPLILDETKQAKSSRDVAAVLYGVANGQGRARGTVKGTALVRSWRTVALTSGEQKATDFTEDGGTRARCIEVTGSPFGGESDTTRAVVEMLKVRLVQHYGHAGLAFVRALLQHRSSWPAWQELYRRRVEQLASVLSSGVGARIASYVAAIETTSAIAHQLLPLPFPAVDAFQDLWPELIAAIDEAPPEIRALQALGSWCQANEQKFLGRGAYEPSGGWAGYWPPGASWEYVALYPPVFRRVLKDLGFEEPAAILEAARARGWLDHEEGRNTKRLGTEERRFIVVRRTALAEVGVVAANGFGPGDARSADHALQTG